MKYELAPVFAVKESTLGFGPTQWGPKVGTLLSEGKVQSTLSILSLKPEQRKQLLMAHQTGWYFEEKRASETNQVQTDGFQEASMSQRTITTWRVSQTFDFATIVSFLLDMYMPIVKGFWLHGISVLGCNLILDVKTIRCFFCTLSCKVSFLRNWL